MIVMTARYAIYFVPDAKSPLWAFGTRVLGCDAYNGQIVPFYSELTSRYKDWGKCVQAPATYGFHATLKAPFRLAPGRTEGELLAAVSATAANLPQLTIGYLRVEMVDRFLALRLETMPSDLQVLEAGLVTRLDEFRAPLITSDITRRQPDTLSHRQLERLMEWGYPFCLEEFRFHMTLAGPLQDEYRKKVLNTLSDLYEPSNEPVRISDVALVKQLSASSPFFVMKKFQLSDAEHVGLVNSTFVLSHR